MNVLKTRTGKEYQSSYLTSIANPPRLYLRICGSNIVELAQVFSDPNEIEQLEYNGQIISGYTTLKNIGPESNCIKITLAKEN